MNTTTNAQNQNSQQGGRDLGQISKEERDHRLFSFDVYKEIFGSGVELCEVTYTPSGKKAFVSLNMTTEKREALALLIDLGWGFHAASYMADLTSTNKAHRDFAKGGIRNMANLGAWAISEAHSRILAAREA